jgi:tetratricopeptide (TPR) repeat protein
MKLFRTLAVFVVVFAFGSATGFAAENSMRTRGGGASPILSFGAFSSINEAAIALEKREWQKGVNLARSALSSSTLSSGSFPLVYNNMCIGLTFMQQSEEAMDYCNKAVEGRPRQWQFYNNRAIAHFYQGDYDRSLADYYMALMFGRGHTLLLENIHLTLKARKAAAPHAGST